MSSSASLPCGPSTWRVQFGQVLVSAHNPPTWVSCVFGLSRFGQTHVLKIYRTAQDHSCFQGLVAESGMAKITPLSVSVLFLSFNIYMHLFAAKIACIGMMPFTVSFWESQLHLSLNEIVSFLMKLPLGAFTLENNGESCDLLSQAAPSNHGVYWGCLTLFQWTRGRNSLKHNHMQGPPHETDCVGVVWPFSSLFQWTRGRNSLEGRLNRWAKRKMLVKKMVPNTPADPWGPGPPTCPKICSKSCSL